MRSFRKFIIGLNLGLRRGAVRLQIRTL